jgi:hypothetical protein
MSSLLTENPINVHHKIWILEREWESNRFIEEMRKTSMEQLESPIIIPSQACAAGPSGEARL